MFVYANRDVTTNLFRNNIYTPSRLLRCQGMYKDRADREGANQPHKDR